MSERDIPSLLQDILEATGNIKDFTRGIIFEMYLGDLLGYSTLKSGSVRKRHRCYSGICFMNSSCCNKLRIKE
jgi:hypothetical protein